jgi:hypothetical protein
MMNFPKNKVLLLAIQFTVHPNFWLFKLGNRGLRNEVGDKHFSKAAKHDDEDFH